MSIRRVTKSKQVNTGVTIASFTPGAFIKYTATNQAPAPTLHVHNKTRNGKHRLAVEDRGHLKDIEIYLNKCVNLAERLEGKEADKMLRLLREARDRAIRLRG